MSQMMIAGTAGNLVGPLLGVLYQVSLAIGSAVLGDIVFHSLLPDY